MNRIPILRIDPAHPETIEVQQDGTILAIWVVPPGKWAELEVQRYSLRALFDQRLPEETVTGHAGAVVRTFRQRLERPTAVWTPNPRRLLRLLRETGWANAAWMADLRTEISELVEIWDQAMREEMAVEDDVQVVQEMSMEE
jgi:hypothetical protein